MNDAEVAQYSNEIRTQRAAETGAWEDLFPAGLLALQTEYGVDHVDIEEGGMAAVRPAGDKLRRIWQDREANQVNAIWFVPERGGQPFRVEVEHSPVEYDEDDYANPQVRLFYRNGAGDEVTVARFGYQIDGRS
jgi:hypothetical protein